MKWEDEFLCNMSSNKVSVQGRGTSDCKRYVVPTNSPLLFFKGSYCYSLKHLVVFLHEIVSELDECEQSMLEIIIILII